uniref:Uncharacterized protein n=1 Tax=Anopheles culicifacies TaxID=139723 RepID=A0A182M2N3_9DIPT
MLDESSSEVTSSSAALVMSPGMTMSPTSLGSPEYNELELWGAYDENAYNGHSVLSNGNNNLGGGGCGAVAANQLLMNGIMNVGNNLNGMMNGIGLGPGTVGSNGPAQASTNQIQQFVGNLMNGMNHSQTIIPPLPSIIQNTIMNTPRSESVNSISSGKCRNCQECLFVIHKLGFFFKRIFTQKGNFLVLDCVCVPLIIHSGSPQV